MRYRFWYCKFSTKKNCMTDGKMHVESLWVTRSVCVQIELDRKTSGALGELVYFMNALFILL